MWEEAMMQDQDGANKSKQQQANDIAQDISNIYSTQISEDLFGGGQVFKIVRPGCGTAINEKQRQAEMGKYYFYYHPDEAQ